VSLLDDLIPLLTTARLGRAARAFDAVGSTMTEAAAWAAEGAPDGALVVARRQTAGRGRHGRTWADEDGASLLVSLVLRPALPPERLGLVPLAVGVAAAEAVERVADLRPALKWPNDLLLDGRKAGGILVEGQLTPGRPATLVVGVGLNVGQASFPPELAGRATSLARAAGRPVEHAPLLAALLDALERHLDGLADGGTTLRAAWEARMAGRGAAVTVAFPNTPRPPLSGRALGLAPDGALRLATPDGEVAVHAGEVTVLKGAVG
jgi:BirA family biotin operon repressor/biotin-[acetyl-CoA-carboxylase] ligase